MTLKEALDQRGLRSNYVARRLSMSEPDFSRMARAEKLVELTSGQLEILAEILRISRDEVAALLLHSQSKETGATANME